MISLNDINDNKVLVPADKTRNLCKMEKEDYKFLSKNITKTYKKLNRTKVYK